MCSISQGGRPDSSSSSIGSRSGEVRSRSPGGQPYSRSSSRGPSSGEVSDVIEEEQRFLQRKKVLIEPKETISDEDSSKKRGLPYYKLDENQKYDAHITRDHN